LVCVTPPIHPPQLVEIVWSPEKSRFAQNDQFPLSCRISIEQYRGIGHKSFKINTLIAVLGYFLYQRPWLFSSPNSMVFDTIYENSGLLA